MTTWYRSCFDIGTSSGADQEKNKHTDRCGLGLRITALEIVVRYNGNWYEIHIYYSLIAKYVNLILTPTFAHLLVVFLADYNSYVYEWECTHTGCRVFMNCNVPLGFQKSGEVESHTYLYFEHTLIMSPIGPFF